MTVQFSASALLGLSPPSGVSFSRPLLLTCDPWRQACQMRFEQNAVMAILTAKVTRTPPLPSELARSKRLQLPIKYCAAFWYSRWACNGQKRTGLRDDFIREPF
jgi:hypothetical protein